MIQTRDDVLRGIAPLAPRLRALGVRRLGLFGSFARNEAKPHSDLDLLVELQTNSFDAYMDTKFLLEDELRRPIDLVLANTLKPRLRENILRELVLVPGF